MNRFSRTGFSRTRFSRSTLRLTLALAATGALGSALASQAAAAEPQISASASGAGTLATSSYLAGYQTTQIGISRAHVSFRVPTLTCSATNEGTIEGIGNEQTFGAPTALGGVWNACLGGGPFQQIYAQAPSAGQDQDPAAPGDLVRVLITQTRTSVKVKVTNVTSGAVASVTGAPTPDNSLTFGSFPLFSGGMLPVADFGSIRMLKPTLENTNLQAWSPTSLNRKSSPTVTQISAGPFNPTTGAFSLVFRNH